VKRNVAAAAALFVLLACADARAVEIEHEHHLGLGPSLAMLKIDDKSTLSSGAGLDLHYTYGLDDQFELLADASWAIVALHQDQDNADSPHTRPASVGTLGAGMGYVVDVLTWVPYFGGLGGVAEMSGGTLDRRLWLADFSIVAGLDYRFSHHFEAGVAYRQHMFLSDQSTYPSYSLFTFRAEYKWGGTF
jgi:opacity protein-like surface antigen